MSRDVQKRLSDSQVVALRCRGDGWRRGLLGETPIPDAWMGLVVRPDGRRRFVPAGEDPRPERDDTLVLVRNRAITVLVAVADVTASDGHAVSATVEMLLRCPARDDELAALHEALLGAEELTLDLLSKAVSDAGAPAALRRFVQERAAGELVQTDHRDALVEALRTALKRFLFSAGLELERVGKVEFCSASLARHDALQQQTARRVKELEARGVVEHAALAATRRRIEGLSEILSKLKAVAAGGDVQWRELLPSLTPGERGRLLENLWRLTPDRTVAQAIVVVAGYECVWLDPQKPQEIVRRVTLPGELGGLRSVSFDSGGDALLLGAATGVWRISAASGEVLGRYAVPGRESTRTGFNAAIVAAPALGARLTADTAVAPGERRPRGADATDTAVAPGARLFATHSQLGAWSWSVEDATDVHPVLQPIGGVPKTVRAVCVDERGHVLLAADDRVHAYTAAGDTLWQSGAAGAAIHCLAPLADHVYAGTAGGTLLRCDVERPGEWLVVHRVLGAIETVQARRWDDLVELVIPAGSEGVCGVYAAEGIVSRLLHATMSLRRAWACDDALIALSEQRDRLVVLNAVMPEHAGWDVPAARLLGRAVQDACIVTRHEGTGRDERYAGTQARRDEESHGATEPRSHEEGDEGERA